MYLRIISLWTRWDPNTHSIYGLSCQKAWRRPVCRSKHVAYNKRTIKSVVPDIPMFYVISSIQYNWLEWQLIANHPPASCDNHRSVRNILRLGIGHHSLVMRPLTLPECPTLTLGHICLWAGKRFGQKLSCGAVLAGATSSPSWSSLECLCSREHAGKDMGVLHW